MIDFFFKYSTLFRWFFPAILLACIAYGLICGNFRNFIDVRHLFLLFFCFLAYLAILALNAIRWVIVLRIYEIRFSLRLSLLWTMIGHFFNQILPTSVGGDAVRIWQVARQIPLRFAISSVVTERLVGFIALLVLIFAGLPLVFIKFDLGVFLVLFSFIILFVVVLIVFMFIDRFFNNYITSRVLLAAARIISDVRELFNYPTILFLSVSISLLMHLFNALITVFVSRKLGADVGLVDIMLIMPSVMLVSSLPISVGGWGVREAGLALGFSVLGQSISVAIATSIILGLANLISGLPGALAWSLIPQSRRHQVGRQPTESA